MGWIKNKIATWAQYTLNKSYLKKAYDDGSAKWSTPASINCKSCVRFTIYAASGGHVIEYYKQDRYKEGDGPELVIVAGEQSIGQSVEHILTMEALKS